MVLWRLRVGRAAGGAKLYFEEGGWDCGAQINCTQRADPELGNLASGRRSEIGYSESEVRSAVGGCKRTAGSSTGQVTV